MTFTIFKRLAVGFLLILLVVTVLGAYSTLKLRELNQIIRSISSIDSETIRMAERLRDNLLTQRRFEKKYAVSKDRDFYRQFLETGTSVRKDLDQMSSLIGTTENKNLIADLKVLHEHYLFTVQEEAGFIETNGKYSDGPYEEAKEVLTDQIIRGLDALIRTTAAAVDAKMDTSRQIGSQAMRIIVILTLTSIIMAILLAFYNARTIHRPILLLKKEIKEIARGRFDKHVAIPSPPEISELADAFNDMCDRLKELDEMKADLISHISHEFRTPLAVIREAVSLHLDSLATGAVERQRRLLGIVEEECERLITSVNKVLDLSRMDAGMMEYQMEAHSLSHLIDISASKIRPIAIRKGISLEVRLADGLPHAVVDADKIGQVLDNLLVTFKRFGMVPIQRI